MTKLLKTTALVATTLTGGLVYLLVHRSGSGDGETKAAPALDVPVEAVAARGPSRARSSAHPAPQAPGPDQATGSVTGRLVDARSGDPISGVTVSCQSAGERSVVSDEEGTFTLAALPVGRPLRIRVGTGQGYLQDVIDAAIAPGESAADVGNVRLLKGDWTSRFDGQKRGLTGINNVLRDGKIIITAVRPDTPAARAGLSAGERIVAVDGTNVDGLGHAARSYFLEGPAGTAVTLLVESPEGATRSVVLKREPRPGADNGQPEFY